MQDVVLARSDTEQAIDRLVLRAARRDGATLTDHDVWEITCAAVLAIHDAVRARREDRDAAIAAQFAGLPAQIDTERRTAAARAWWSDAAFAARCRELRGGLHVLRARDGHLSDLDAAA